MLIHTHADLEKQIALDDDDESLRLVYVDIDILAQFFLSGNSKLHGIAELEEMVARHGFRDPMIFDTNLNRGKGGIVAGNGRLEMLIEMHGAGFAIPKGVMMEGGQWFAPLLLGLNAENEEEAIAFSIDHNMATLGGGELSFRTKAMLFDQKALMAQLDEIEMMPVSVVDDDLEDLRRALEGVSSWDGEDAEEGQEVEGGERSDRVEVEEDDEEVEEVQAPPCPQCGK